jgi:hypothetical protein
VRERPVASSLPVFPEIEAGAAQMPDATALLRDSAPDGLPEALSGLHINPPVSAG